MKKTTWLHWVAGIVLSICSYFFWKYFFVIGEGFVLLFTKHIPVTSGKFWISFGGLLLSIVGFTIVPGGLLSIGYYEFAKYFIKKDE